MRIIPIEVKKIAVALHARRSDSFLPIKSILSLIRISKSSLYNYIKENKKGLLVNNTVKSKRKNKSKITVIMFKFIVAYVLRRKFFNCDKLIKFIQKNFHMSVSRSSIYRILKNSKVTYKRVSNIKISNSKKKITAKDRRNLLQKVHNKTLDKIISIDETSVAISYHPTYGWSPANTKCKYKSSGTIYRRFSLIFAISNKKVIAYKTVVGSVNGEIFKDFIMSDVVPKVNDCYLLMDNARIHHYRKLKETIKDTNNEILYNLPYNPQNNPIEGIFSLLKHHLRTNFVNTNQKFNFHIKKFTRSLSQQILENFFNKFLPRP